MRAALNQRGMKTAVPECAPAVLAQVVVPCIRALQPVHHLRHIRHPGDPQQQVDVIRRDRVVEEPQAPELPRRLEQTTFVLPPINPELQQVRTLLTTVCDMHAAITNLRSWKTHWQVDSSIHAAFRTMPVFRQERQDNTPVFDYMQILHR